MNYQNIEDWIRKKTTAPIDVIELQEDAFKLFQKIGADAAKALVRRAITDVRMILRLRKKKYKASLPKPTKIEQTWYFTINTNHNMIVDKRRRKRGRRNQIVVRLAKGLAVSLPVPKGFDFVGLKIQWLKDMPARLLYLYEAQSFDLNLNPDNWAAIDVGIDNLAAIISNHGPSVLVDGKPIKSFNQWYNKTAAKLRSESKIHELRLLGRYRKKRIKYYLSSAANRVIEYCIEHNIGTLVLSRNLGKIFNQRSKLSKQSNQIIRSLPLQWFIDTIARKAESIGIKIIWVDEAYTSKISALTGNLETKTANGKRVKRGLFKDTKLNKVWNADLNGALNMARKALNFSIVKDLIRFWLRKLASAIRITVFQKYSPSVRKDIGDSTCQVSTCAGPQELLSFATFS